MSDSTYHHPMSRKNGLPMQVEQEVKKAEGNKMYRFFSMFLALLLLACATAVLVMLTVWLGFILFS